MSAKPSIKQPVNSKKKKRKKRSWKQQQPRMQARRVQPVLRVSPYMWAKYNFLYHYSSVEVSGFGVCRDPDDPLLVHDLVLVDQTCSEASTDMDDASVAAHIEDHADRGLQPDQCGRIWFHTHPGMRAVPSGTDEDTFERAFGANTWAIMGILGEHGHTYCRMLFRTGSIKSDQDLKIEIDWSVPFEESDHNAWEDEFIEHVTDWQPYGLAFHGSNNWQEKNGVITPSMLAQFDDGTPFDKERELLERKQAQEDAAWDEDLWGRYAEQHGEEAIICDPDEDDDNDSFMSYETV